MNNQHVFYWKWNFISLEYPGYFLEHTRMNHIVGCISHSIPIHIHCHELNLYWTHQTLWHTISSQPKMNNFRIVIFCYSPCKNFPSFSDIPVIFPHHQPQWRCSWTRVYQLIHWSLLAGYHGIPWMITGGDLHDLGIFRIGTGVYYIRVYIIIYIYIYIYMYMYTQTICHKKSSCPYHKSTISYGPTGMFVAWEHPLTVLDMCTYCKPYSYWSYVYLLSQWPGSPTLLLIII